MSMIFEPDELPAIDSQGKPTRVIVHGNFRFELDLSTQVLVISEFKLSKRAATAMAAEQELIPTLAGGIMGKFVSAGVLMHKAKQFDDGLYAAVELAAQNGAGSFGGKKSLLRALTDALLRQAPTKAAAIVAGAARLGGLPLELSAFVQTMVRQELKGFLTDPLRSKPLGFYTWSRDLSAIFKQDRLLQTALTMEDGALAIARVLAGDAAARETYERYLELAARLSNPSKYTDFRSLLAGNGVAAAGSSYCVFPASTSMENQLVERLFRNRPVPEGFDLMDELISRIRSGEIDLAPTERSGWYDHQAFALEPLARPDKTDEARHLRLDDEYKRLLIELFKGALALARETHVKQTERYDTAARHIFPIPREEVHVTPELSAEPLVTHYRRRAEGYRFLHAALRETFGPMALSQLHRQTAQRPIEQNLESELVDMTDLFEGAAGVTARQLGLAMPSDKATAKAFLENAAGVFLNWAARLAADPDLSQDTRMMVPVFFDRDRGLTKAWVFLGWTRHLVKFDVETRPAVAVFDPAGRRIDELDGPELIWDSRVEPLLYPVTTEVYVGRLLDRDEFRRHCDTHRTRSAILGNLE